MKILLINAIVGNASTGRSVLEMAEAFSNSENECHIAFSTGKCTYYSKYRIGTIIDKKIHALFSRISGLQGYFSIIATKRLIHYIRRLHPDIVHLGNLHSNFINLNDLLQFLAISNIATVIHLHDCWFYTGRCFHYTVNNCLQWQSQCKKCPPNTAFNPSWFFDRSGEMWADKKRYFTKIQRLAVVGVSDWITREAKKSFLSGAPIITRIYNWINLEVFRPVSTDELRRELKLDDMFIILGVASLWSEFKGLYKYFELSKRIHNDMIIILIGKISEDILLPDNIIHIQETHNINKLVDYYSLADVFVNLSLEETFGKVTAEALACGTPAIVFNSTANPELIGDGCGYVSEPNDLEGVISNITKIKRAGKVFYSDNCIKYVHYNFGMKERLQDFLNLYNELVI